MYILIIRLRGVSFKKKIGIFSKIFDQKYHLKMKPGCTLNALDCFADMSGAKDIIANFLIDKGVCHAINLSF